MKNITCLFVIVLALLGSCFSLIEEHPVIGSPLTPNRVSFSNSSQVTKLCISTVNDNNPYSSTYISSISYQQYVRCQIDDSDCQSQVTVGLIGVVRDSEYCFDLLYKRIVAYETIGYKRNDGSPVLGVIRIVTSDGTARTFGNIRSEDRLKYAVSGVAKENRYLSTSGRGMVLLGVKGYSIDVVGSVGFVVEQTDEGTFYSYGTPGGSIFNGYNFHIPEDPSNSQIEEFCCEEASFGVKTIFFRTSKGAYAYGKSQTSADSTSNPRQRCITIGSNPITWQTRSSSFSTGRLGYLSITSGLNTITCSGSSYVESDTYIATNRILVGVYGYGGDDIDWLGPIFKDTLSQAVLIGYRLDVDNSQKMAMDPKAVTTQELANESAVSQTITVTGTYTSTSTNTVENSNSFEETTTSTFNFDISVTVEGAYGVADTFQIGGSAGYSFGYEASESSTLTKTWAKGLTTTNTETFTYSVPIAVPAYSKVSAAIRYHESVLDIPYSAIVMYVYTDGSSEVVENRGVFKETGYKYLTVDIEPEVLLPGHPDYAKK